MLDQEQVRKVAHLARLALTPAEEEQLSTELSQILAYVEQLNELDTEAISPTTRAIELSNVTRADILVVDSDRESLLNNAPEREGDFFKVPKILHD